MDTQSWQPQLHGGHPSFQPNPLHVPNVCIPSRQATRFPWNHGALPDGGSFPRAGSCGLSVGRRLISGKRHYSRRFRVDTEITHPVAVIGLLGIMELQNILSWKGPTRIIEPNSWELLVPLVTLKLRFSVASLSSLLCWEWGRKKVLSVYCVLTWCF